LYFSEISNQGFRNLSSDSISFGGGVTLITGENAQGKTNLLEAVALVCGQRSFRGAAPAEMARDGEQFSITASVRSRTGVERLAVSWAREEGREFLRSGKPAGFREIFSRGARRIFRTGASRASDGVAGGSQTLRRPARAGLKPAAGDDLGAIRHGPQGAQRPPGAHPPGWAGSGAPGELEAWTEELSVAGAAVRRHRRAALAEWECDFRKLALRAGGTMPKSASPTRPRKTRWKRCGRTASACSRSSAAGVTHWRAASGRPRLDAPRPAAVPAGLQRRDRAARGARQARGVERGPQGRGRTSPVGADDFDAGLSETWVEEFFDALPEEAAVLLTTAAPRRAGRAAPRPCSRSEGMRVDDAGPARLEA